MQLLRAKNFDLVLDMINTAVQVVILCNSAKGRVRIMFCKNRFLAQLCPKITGAQ